MALLTQSRSRKTVRVTKLVHLNSTDAPLLQAVIDILLQNATKTDDRAILTIKDS